MTARTIRRDHFNRGNQDAFCKPVYPNIRILLYASAASLALCCSVSHANDSDASRVPTRTPIKHLVVIFNENHTFDNYFGTYPKAANNPPEHGWIGVLAPVFHARPDTPKANNYLTNPDVFFHNPNVTATGAQANPIRLRPADAYGACAGIDFGVPPLMRAKV
jgi:Phosphoesterase family